MLRPIGNRRPLIDTLWDERLAIYRAAFRSFEQLNSAAVNTVQFLLPLILKMFAILLAHLILSSIITGTLAANLPVNVLSNKYTLCAHMPGNDLYDGCKVQNLALFKEKCAQYCPNSVQNAGLCPKGVDMAFAGSLYPVCVTLMQRTTS